MEYGDQFSILGADWAYIHFVENNGMAFGLTFGGKAGKLALSIFRILAVGFLIYYLRKMLQMKQGIGILVCFALILAGAIGNIIDSAFYGMIFSESPYHGGLATMFPEEGGYSGFLQGKVVDMFYFPMIDTYWPEWVPGIGGNRFQFFKPVFNVADSSISVGIIILLLFQRKFFSTNFSEPQKEKVIHQPALSATDSPVSSETK